MDTTFIHRMCSAIDKARAIKKIEVSEKHVGGDPKKPKKWSVDVDVTLGNGRMFDTKEEAEKFAEVLRDIWGEAAALIEQRAVHHLRAHID